MHNLIVNDNSARGAVCQIACHVRQLSLAGDFAEAVRDQFVTERQEYFAELEEKLLDETRQQPECTREHLTAALLKINPAFTESQACLLVYPPTLDCTTRQYSFVAVKLECDDRSAMPLAFIAVGKFIADAQCIFSTPLSIVQDIGTCIWNFAPILCCCSRAPRSCTRSQH